MKAFLQSLVVRVEFHDGRRIKAVLRLPMTPPRPKGQTARVGMKNSAGTPKSAGTGTVVRTEQPLVEVAGVEPSRRVSDSAGQSPNSGPDLVKRHTCQYPPVTSGDPDFVSFSCLACPPRVAAGRWTSRWTSRSDGSSSSTESGSR